MTGPWTPGSDPEARREVAYVAENDAKNASARIDRLTAELAEARSTVATLSARVAELERVLKIAATAELYNSATGIIDADVLDIVQSEARKAIRPPPPYPGACWCQDCGAWDDRRDGWSDHAGHRLVDAGSPTPTPPGAPDGK